MADDIATQLIAELDANCAVMPGYYYCGECLQCRASAEIERLRSLSDQLGNALLTMKNLYQHSSRFFDSALQAWIEHRGASH